MALALEDGRKVAGRALTSAVHTGLRYAANSRNLRAILIRAAAFFPFACASWALLPLVARNQMTQGPECYGTLLSMIGAGAIGGSFALDWLKARLGPDLLVAFASLIAAFGLVLLGIARDPIVALCAVSLREPRGRLSSRALCGHPGRLAGLGARVDSQYSWWFSSERSRSEARCGGVSLAWKGYR